MIKREDLIKIGMFNKPHGIKGELSFTFTDDIFDRTDCPYIVCEMDGIFVPFFIGEYRFRSDTTVLIKLDDIDSEEEAKPFTNQDVYFPKSYLKEEEEEYMAPGDYFIGFTLIDNEYGELGRIIELDDTTPNILFVVDRGEGEELLVPANDDFILSIDEEKEVIHVNIPEGLLDL